MIIITKTSNKTKIRWQIHSTIIAWQCLHLFINILGMYLIEQDFLSSISLIPPRLRGGSSRFLRLQKLPILMKLKMTISVKKKTCHMTTLCMMLVYHQQIVSPLGNLHPSQADRIYLNAGSIRFNNQSRKGRVCSKSRRRVFDDTAF